MLKAILIDCIPPNLSQEEAEYRILEAENLIKTYGGVVLVKKIQKKLIPNYATYLGSGKIDEIIEENKTAGKDKKANIIIINNELKPRQTYNLSEKIRKHDLKVWDRIDLILKIFQKHASTKEAKLEIELASIKHMGPRIFGMGIELSRQAGGIGTRGRGETNIEFMRRHLKKMEQSIKKDLEKCRKVRKLHRKSRKRKNLKTVGIIGYTNAGKTSLLNTLTGKGAMAADKLFATLDTRVGKLVFPPKTLQEKSAGQHAPLQPNFGQRPPSEVLISDTIGFIQNLPPQLIKSFQSTLEETIEADLLLHVIDISDPKMNDKIKTVNEILAQIDVLTKPSIYVFNKTDIPHTKNQAALARKYKKYTPCFVSTYKKEGLEPLKETIRERIFTLSSSDDQ
ncbi:MAG TPA: GTPase HflX [Candidatus Gracilibacteria bacterium]|nr:GTPase HflX [Candidatus Gracilibacteria bacterium]